MEKENLYCYKGKMFISLQIFNDETNLVFI